MNLWKKAVEQFGGIPPISMAEDVLFFTQCKNFWGKGFHVQLIKNRNFNFLRGAHNNTSVIEWTDSIDISQLPKWATDKISLICSLLKSQQKFEIFQKNLKKIINSSERRVSELHTVSDSNEQFKCI